MGLALRRLAAWVIDCVCILCWAGVIAAVGVPLFAAGIVIVPNDFAGNVISGLLLIVPVVFTAAWFESRGRSATPGKRMLHLFVRANDGVPRYGAAVLRNAVKIGVPWAIGHAAVFALVGAGSGPPPLGVWVLTASAYLLPLVWILSVFVRDGRAPYDRLSNTSVELTGSERNAPRLI